MKEYYSFFKVRFHVGIQYRTAAVVALLTQFLWGFMECMAFKVLLDSNAAVTNMSIGQVVSYIWLKEAFFALFTVWNTDNDIFDLIVDGGISYELCRPVSIYDMWYARAVGGRVAAASMRCLPIIIGAMLIPKPYGLMMSVSLSSFLWFVITMLLGLSVTVAFCMLVYVLSFFTISPQGLRMLLTGVVELLSGSIIPIPFVPEPYRGLLEILPFASMQNVPLRVYSGNLSGSELGNALFLQVFWLVVLVLAGRILCKVAERKVVVQGG